MATPVGHYLIGLSIARTAARDDGGRRSAPWLAAVACLPDLDVVPGLIVGNLGEFHTGISHSLMTAALFSAAGGLLLFTWGRTKRPIYLVSILFALYASHLVLDFFTGGAGLPRGVPFLWPWPGEGFRSSWALLPKVLHTSGPLIGTHNLLLVFREVLLFLPLVGLVYTLANKSPAWPKRAAWLYGVWLLVAASLSVLSLRLF
jgi:membrane-bound metal-dependent hydrolase YbcI (DUF457 family)